MPIIITLAAATLAGCERKTFDVSYVCEEPLEPYLVMAEANLANDYDAARSSDVLAKCPAQGYHRRYQFDFQKSALVSKASGTASVTASWCNEAQPRYAEATLRLAGQTLRFDFDYPWATPTGKYPRTEFSLNKSSLVGGFAGDRSWQCRLQESGAE